LDHDAALAERAVFALEFEKILDLVQRLDSRLISSESLAREIRKLSPGSFDQHRVALWGIAHRDANEPDPSKMS
jgi:hypothetical protein